jgi:hypothetical protein
MEKRRAPATSPDSSCISKHSIHHHLARSDLARLEHDPDPETEAARYVDQWPNHPPDPFTDRRHIKLQRAFGSGRGWAVRLGSTVDPAHYSIHAPRLGLPDACADPARLFDPANIRLWKGAIRECFSGPLYWTLELGNDRVHPHVIADVDAGLLELPRTGEIVKPCADYLPQLVRYLSGPLEYNARNLALWLEAKRRGKLPRLSGTMRLPNKGTWNQS